MSGHVIPLHHQPPGDSPPRLRGISSTYREPVERIRRRSWEDVRRTVDRLWVPNEAPHHSIVGLTGSGKSYFMTRALLPLVRYDRVLIIDVKGDDPTLRGYGKPVRRLPSRWEESVFRSQRKKPGDDWYRLIVSDDWTKARAQIGAALAQVYKQGKWVVVIDETRSLTDPRIPGLGLRPQVEQLWLRGRSREICVIGMTQAPKWVPSSFYDQPSFVWIGRINDELAQKRLREIGGLSKHHLPIIQSLRKREWLLVAEGGDEKAITGL